MLELLGIAKRRDAFRETARIMRGPGSWRLREEKVVFAATWNPKKGTWPDWWGGGGLRKRFGANKSPQIPTNSSARLRPNDYSGKKTKERQMTAIDG